MAGRLAGIGLLALLALWTGPASTEEPPPPSFSLPVDCTPDVDCWVFNHVDLDPGPGRRDYRCGSRTHDGHDGTGFGLANLARIEDHVEVRAAAEGLVVGVRDGMPDVSVKEAGKAAVKGRECGNGVRIEHGGGWVTQYCHLRRGSVAVEIGQPVTAGQRLGEVGLSGMTDHPHAFFSVRKHNTPVDPFRGVEGGPACGRGTAPLWNEATLRALPDEAPAIVDASFATARIDARDAEAGTAALKTAGTDAEALILWVRILGIEPGDTMSLVINGPNGGEIFSQAWTAEQTRMLVFRYAGKRRKVDAWEAGVYTRRVTLAREGGPTRRRTVTLRLAGKG